MALDLSFYAKRLDETTHCIYRRVTADTQIKSSAGYLHTLTFSQSDAAPTAGTITVYDSLTEAGVAIFTHTFTTAVFQPYTLTFDVEFATGLYIGFATTADVSVTVAYR